VIIRVHLGNISSLREVLSDQPISWCCIDRLSWHRFSGVGIRRLDGGVHVMGHAASSR
jgi:hypothetical protein